MTHRHTIFALAGLTLTLSPVVGCGGETSSSSDRPAVAADAPETPAKESRMIIDVRTPAEFAGGHLDAA